MPHLALRSVSAGLLLMVVLPAVALAGSERVGRSASNGTHIGTTTYTVNTVWNLAGSPYVLDGNVTVASGVTLTINPGVVVKLNGQLRELRVNGTLSALGSLGSEIAFTSVKDDTVGGDSNGDGAATSPAAGDWYQLYITAGTASELRHVKVRYGGWGSSDSAYGAISVANAGTQVTIANAEIKNNQRSGIYLNSGGATVSASTITQNGNGISANMGWVRLKDRSFVTNNASDGLWFNYTASYSGTTSQISDSDVSGNGNRGIYIQADQNLAAAKHPLGSRNNIYANGPSQTGGKQLDALYRRWDVDWTGNYWGSDVYFWPAHAMCPSQAGSYGHLAYRWSNPPDQYGAATPPQGPLPHATVLAFQGSDIAWCPQDDFKLWPLEFSPFYLGGAQPVLANGQATLCESTQAWFDKIGLNIPVCKGDPVNSALGNFTHQVTDVSLPGIGITFDFVRTYSSLDTTGGPVGQGWTHNHAAALAIKASGDLSLRTPDGQSFEYVKQQDGSFARPPAGLATLASVSGGYALVTPERVTTRFDANGRLESVKDGNGKGLTYAYDANGRLSTITDATGRVINLTYDGAGKLTQVSLPDGRSVAYAYTNGRLTSVTDVTNKVWTYTYESHGLLEKETDPLNHVVFRNVYEKDGRVKEQYDALNNKTTFAWDYQTQTQTTTDARNNVWKHVYEANVLKKEIDPFNNETTFGYDASLNRTTETDALGKTWTMTYDARGNMLTRTAPSPLSYVESWTYSTNNDVLSHTGGRGNSTTFSYDGSGNLTQVTQPGSVITQIAYNASGLPTSVTDARSKVWALAYDSQGNLNQLTTPLGKVTTAVYDSAGRLTSFVEPRGNVQGANPNDYKWTFTFDAAGRPLTQTDPLGNQSTLAYDSDGRLTSVTDAKSNATSYAYDAANRLTSVTAPGGAATTYGYDAVGNPTTKTDPLNHTTTYVHDAGNRLTSVTSPNSKTWQYTYNAGNRLTVATLPSGGTITSGYDAVGRVTSVDYSDSTPDVSLTYDANGNLTQMTDGQGTVTAVFDALNRMTSSTRGTDAFAYAYDAASNITQRTLPDARVMSYVYDDDGNLSSVTTGGLTTSYAYDAASNPTQVTLPSANGYAETRTFDRAGRLTQIGHTKSGQTLSAFAYTLDAVGNPTQIVRSGGLSETQTLSYDVRDRLTEVCYQGSCPGGSDPFIRWTYDAAGNRLTEARPAGTTSYSYNADDQLTQAGSTNYSYDSNGNMTQAGSRTLAWDLGGRLASTTLGGTTATFAYDGLGNRAQQTTGNQVVKSLWDQSVGPPLLALERDGQGQTLRSYTHGLGLVSMLSGGQQHYLHGDALGSSSNLTSASGSAEWTYAYEPYGAARTTTQNDPSAPANLIRFGGEYLDDSGLYNLRARMYEPSTGRFASRSPLPRSGSEPTASGYSYVDNRPTSRVSPNGMTSVPPPTTEGCGPGITRCSLEKLANEPCPPPLTPYMGLPGFKGYWLAGYYAVCNGLRAMLREQLEGLTKDEDRPRCGGRETAIGAASIVVGAGVLVFGFAPSVLARGGTWATADLLSQIGGPSLKLLGDVGKGVFGGSSIGYGIYCLAR